MAFDLLEPDDQERVIRILRQHPRFKEDFTEHQKHSSSDERHWIIGRAGYWPDVARKQPEFNRPNWHYQLGASLTIGQNLKVHETPGPLPESANLQTKDLHIAQAIELCRKTLKESDSDSDKALAICWLAHLVADAHQPCHAGSLYAEGIFPEGDRGANSIPTKQAGNLHALWDRLLGPRYDSGDVARRIHEIRTDVSLWNDATASRRVLEPLEWLRESQELARLHVYSPEVLNAVEATQRSGATEIAKIDLPEHYLKAAGTLAQKRAAVAAFRLAAMLRAD